MTYRVLGPTQANPYHHLFDHRTGQDLGPATNQQVAWSDQSVESYGDSLGGSFVIDREGNLVRFGTTAYANERAVYTDYPERQER